MPRWMLELEDQIIAFGKDHTYKMGTPVDNFYRPIEVEVNLRKASRFITYSNEDERNSLIVHGDRMRDTFVISYKVTVSTVFTDIYGSEQYFWKDVHFLLVHLNFPIRLPETIKFIGDPDIDFEISDDVELSMI